MGVFQRFGSIMSANINALLDKCEDPEKMIDQYLREATENLAEVKKETAGVMATEAKAKRALDENQAQVAKYTELAKKALLAGNEGDAKQFMAKKLQIEGSTAGLQKTYDIAHANAEKLRQMHDKLVADVETLKSRRENVKATMAVAKTQEAVNRMASSSGRVEGAMGAFQRMEEKADAMLDQAAAMAELSTPKDETADLEARYTTGDASVDSELAKLKAEMGLS